MWFDITSRKDKYDNKTLVAFHDHEFFIFEGKFERVIFFFFYQGKQDETRWHGRFIEIRVLELGID